MVSKYAPIHQAFAEQIAFFRQKLNLPTEAWDDIERAAHDRAFIVAGAQGADLLNDLRGAVDKAIEQGTGLEQFRKDFAQIVAKHGWTGWTGEGTKAGVAWRTKVIYQTNMATSYAAGRWKQLNDPALLKIMPYWQYHHNDSVLHPRPLHLLWDGLTLPPDHPFWQTHFPPGGWGCQCWVSAVTKEKYMLAIANGKGKPPEGWDAVDPKTSAPVGIDKGFDYAPGANVDRSLKDFIDKKLITYPPAIAKALESELAPVLDGLNTGEKTYKDYGRLDLRDVPSSDRLAVPLMLPRAKNRSAAMLELADALGLSQSVPLRTITTPTGDVTIQYEWLPHLVEKEADARERYANLILPTLENPYEVWQTEYANGSRQRYIGLFDQNSDLLVVVRLNEDGSLMWNIMQGNDKTMNKQRQGILLYGK